MKKTDYEAWLSMPLTQEVFRHWKYRQKQQNEDLANGLLIRSTPEETLQIYYKIVGCNEILNKLAEWGYEDLLDLPQELENEKEPDNN